MRMNLVDRTKENTWGILTKNIICLMELNVLRFKNNSIVQARCKISMRFYSINGNIDKHTVKSNINLQLRFHNPNIQGSNIGHTSMNSYIYSQHSTLHLYHWYQHKEKLLLKALLYSQKSLHRYRLSMA